MVSGRQTLRSIEQSISNLKQQERGLLRELERATKSHMGLLSDRTGAFRELAEVRTRSAIADGVIDRADQLQHKVESVLIARQTTIAALQDRDRTADERRRLLLEASEEILAEIALLEERLDEAGRTAVAQLETEPAYIELTTARDASRSVYENAEKKAKQAESDYAEKGTSYESDPLFMYLWQRKYGLSGYRPISLIRMGDDFVARHIGYSEARANYSMLAEIPARLRQHCNALLQRSKEAEAAVEAAEAQRVREIAAVDLLALLAAARARQGDKIKKLEAVEAESSEVDRQLTLYGEGLDASLAEAIELSARFLEQNSLQDLIQQARQTIEPSDDQIVARIAEIDRRVGETQREIAGFRKDLDAMARRRSELIEVAQRFRRNRYDDPGSVFQPDDTARDLLEQLVRGAITAADYWQRSQRGHGWDRRPADPFRRGSGLPPFGGGWGGSGGSGGSGDDDFRTGGGF